jgi:ketosteroid isomerase-like protein
LRAKEGISPLRFHQGLAVAVPAVARHRCSYVKQGTYRGRARLREFLADNAESFEVFDPSYDYIRAVGDDVIALGTLRIRGKGGGVELEVPSALVVTYRDGKVVRFEDVTDRAKALEAVGLTEEDTTTGTAGPD